MTTRNAVTERVFFEYSDFDAPLVDFIKRLQDALEAIPEEHRQSAIFKVEDTGSEQEVAKITVIYERPLTADEVAARRYWSIGYDWTQKIR